MSPTLLRLGAAALACAGGVFADRWQLQDVYNSNNFVDNFDFFTVWARGKRTMLT